MTKREIGWLIAGAVGGVALAPVIRKIPVVGSVFGKIPTVG